MSTLSPTISDEYTQRYEALLRATNAIGTCSDCDTAADVLLQALRFKHKQRGFDRSWI